MPSSHTGHLVVDSRVRSYTKDDLALDRPESPSSDGSEAPAIDVSSCTPACAASGSRCSGEGPCGTTSPSSGTSELKQALAEYEALKHEALYNRVVKEAVQLAADAALVEQQATIDNQAAALYTRATELKQAERERDEAEDNHSSLDKAYKERYAELIEARAELAVRDRMLDAAWEHPEVCTDKGQWLADLRVRAEEASS